MDSLIEQNLRDFYEDYEDSFKTTENKLIVTVDEFIDYTQAVVEEITRAVEHYEIQLKPSKIQGELDRLVKMLDKLSPATISHLRYAYLHSPEIIPYVIKDSGRAINPVDYLKYCAYVPYRGGRSDSSKWNFIARRTRAQLEAFGFTCTPQKNDPYVEYLRIIRDLLDWEFDEYVLARNYFKGPQ